MQILRSNKKYHQLGIKYNNNNNNRKQFNYIHRKIQIQMYLI